MIQTLYIAFLAFVAVATVVMLAACWVQSLPGRRRCADQLLGDKYLHIIMREMMASQPELPSFPQIGRAGARLLLVQVIASLVATTYGLDTAPLRRVVDAYGLDRYLVRRISRSWGYRRAYYLSLLARLPVGVASVSRIAGYTHRGNRYVRFYALMTQLSSDPSTSLRLMAAYPYPFSAYEVSEIMTMLRRGMLPIAYGPLIDSPNRNLRVVGLGIVRQFGIEDAERNLLRILDDDRIPELGREALYVLCAMRRPLTRREVAHRIAMMNRAERRSLLRYMALEGYSPVTLNRLFDSEERPYYDSIVLSYKRRLACS